MGRVHQLAWYWTVGENLSPLYTNWDWPNYGVPLTDWDDGLTDWDYGIYGPERFRTVSDQIWISDSVVLETTGSSLVTRSVSDGLSLSDSAITDTAQGASATDSLFFLEMPVVRDIAKRPSEGLLVVDFASMLVNGANLRGGADKLWFIDSGATAVTGGDAGLNHGDSFTVTGSGFGSKSTAAPLIWDPCTAASLVAAGWSGGWPNNATNSNNNIAYRVAQHSVPLLHSRNGTKYMAGNHVQQNYDMGGNVMAYYGYSTPSFPYTMYYSWYQRFDPNWDPTLNVVPDGTNLKLWDHSIGVEPFNLPHNWYFEFNYLPPNKTDDTTYHMNDDDYPNNFSIDSPQWWGSDIPNPYGAVWTRLDMEVKFSQASGGGYIKQWHNGGLTFDKTTKTDGMSDAHRCDGIGGYTRNTGNNDTQWRYFQDLYFDNSPARVMLGNATTLSASTVLANQIMTSWGSTSIGITVNLGAFSNGATAYFHVVDSTGAAHNNVMGAQTLGS